MSGFPNASRKSKSASAGAAALSAFETQGRLPTAQSAAAPAPAAIAAHHDAAFVQDEYDEAPAQYSRSAEHAPELGLAGAPVDGAGANRVQTLATTSEFRWKATPHKKDVTEVRPLNDALKIRGLAGEEQLNVAGVYVQSFANPTPHKLGVQLKGVNGRDLKLFAHPGEDEWSTFVMQPHETKNFMDQNGGKGLLLAANPLDVMSEANANISLKDIDKDLQTRADWTHDGEPTHYFITADFSSFADPDFANGHQGNVENKLSTAAKLLYSNAKMHFNLHPAVIAAFGEMPLSKSAYQALREVTPPTETVPKMQARLVPLKRNNVYTNAFDDIHISPDEHARSPGVFVVRVSRHEFDEMQHNYRSEVQSNSRPTDPNHHYVRVHRVGSEKGEHIGEISTQTVHNVSAGEAERLNKVTSGAHVQLVYDVQHPGTSNVVVGGKR